MTPERYITPLSAVVSPTWVPLGNGRLITTEPLRSSDGVATYARIPYRQQLALAADCGAMLPTRAEMIALHEFARGLGTELRPVILPTPAICAAHGVEWRDEVGKQRLREQYMMGAEWCEIHDAIVDDQQRPDAYPLANIGKPAIRTTPPEPPVPVGHGALMGWWLDGKWIQSGLYPPGSHFFHDDEYTDYSWMTVLVRAA